MTALKFEPGLNIRPQILDIVIRVQSVLLAVGASVVMVVNVQRVNHIVQLSAEPNVAGSPVLWPLRYDNKNTAGP